MKYHDEMSRRFHFFSLIVHKYLYSVIKFHKYEYRLRYLKILHLKCKILNLEKDFKII